MTNQQALDRIEELLRARKDTRAGAAWDAITLSGIDLAHVHIGRVPRDISDWPEGAVWGILEHDVCDALGWDELDYWLLASGAWQARIFHHRGSPWHSGATRNLALADAIIAALLEEANG